MDDTVMAKVWTLLRRAGAATALEEADALMAEAEDLLTREAISHVGLRTAHDLEPRRLAGLLTEQIGGERGFTCPTSSNKG